MIRQNQVNGRKLSVSVLLRWSPVSRLVCFLGIATDTQLVEDSKNPYNEEIQVYELTGGVELVPLLTSRRYYSQPRCIRHVVTDATRPGYTIESYVSRIENEISRFPLAFIFMRRPLIPDSRYSRLFLFLSFSWIILEVPLPCYSEFRFVAVPAEFRVF